MFAISSAKAQTWVKQQLDNRMAVKFPTKPKMLTTPTSVSYRDTDRYNFIYSAGIIDFTVVAHMDSTTLAAMKDTQPFADALKGGMASTAKAYVLGDVTIGKWKGFTSYTITGVSDEKKTKMYLQFVFIGNKGYSLSCVVPDAAASPKSKDDYFAMVELSN